MAFDTEGGDPAPPSPNSQALGYWLSLLRDGTDDEKARARTEVGLILEARGQLEAAADAYLTNVKLRITDRLPYERLAAIRRARGDLDGEASVLLAMQSVQADQTLASAAPVATRRRRYSRQSIVLVAFASLILVGIGVGLVAYRLSTSYTVRQFMTQMVIPNLPTFGTLRTPSGLPCYDPIGHFPEWADPENAVLQAAIVAFGNTRYSGNPTARLIWDAVPQEPDLTIAGWMAVSLVAQRSNSLSPSLPEFVRVQTESRLGRAPRPGTPIVWVKTLSSAGWEQLRALPALDCVGAMLRHPTNTRLVRLMSLHRMPSQ